MIKQQKLSTSIVYGPIKSRRVGWSLGINLSSKEGKLCSFSCAYCQVGEAPKKQFPSFIEVKKEIKEKFKLYVQHPEIPIDCISFAGNGEPTLHPQFNSIVQFVCKIRDHYFPKIPIAVFSNATTLDNSKVIQALEKVDYRFMKIDAIDQKTFGKINCPANPKQLSKIIDNLKKLSQLMPINISTAVIDSKPFDNYNTLKNKKFLKIIKEINPSCLDLYSIDRPPKDKRIRQIKRQKLHSLAQKVRLGLDIPVRVLRVKKIAIPWPIWSKKYQL